jgi:hypothetical protein
MYYRSRGVWGDVAFAATRAKAAIYSVYGLFREKPEFSRTSDIAEPPKGSSLNL